MILGARKCRQVGILLVIRSGEHAERTSEDRAETMERVRALPITPHSLLMNEQLGTDILWPRGSNGEGIGHHTRGGVSHGPSQTRKSAQTFLRSRAMIANTIRYLSK